MPLTRPQTARAWVNFNGTGTVSIRDDFNVSSITDHGVGGYTVHFDQPMPNINYSISVNCRRNSATPRPVDYTAGNNSIYDHGLSSVRIDTWSTDGASYEDPLTVNFILFGDAS